MPSQSPIGGFSLIFHITINVFSFVYRNIKKILCKRKIKTLDKYIKYLFNEDGNTIIRRLVSYSLVIIVFFSINGMAVYVLFTAITSRADQKIKSTNMPSFIQKDYDLVYDYNLKKPQEIQNFAIATAENKTILNNIDKDFDISLVEKLIELGIKNPSFELRARLAKEFDVVSDENQYNGSPSQNLIILRRMNSNKEFTETIIKNISETN